MDLSKQKQVDYAKQASQSRFTPKSENIHNSQYLSISSICRYCLISQCYMSEISDLFMLSSPR